MQAMSRPRPRLRNGVDLQLQSAFHDGNWPVAVRLAEKRLRTLGDAYFEVVKICAESQLDDPGAKLMAVDAVWRFAGDAAAASDVDAVDLLEWATLNLLRERDFAATLGPLRVRAVKAAPKDRSAAARCLESCLLHWDLVSAQQIVAIMDRSFPGERAFLFWNIAITHALATSPQAPPEKHKLYGTLAQKQIERAAQLTEQARTTAAEDAPPSPPVRAIRTEEEILLLYDVVETHGAAADVARLLASPVFSPVSQFRLGRKELFVRFVDRMRRQGDWQAIFDVCSDCLADADVDDEPTLLACDWLVWRHFIDAATHLRSVNPNTQKAVQDLLLTLVRSSNLRPIYRRNVLLARVSAAFNLGPGDEDDLQGGKPCSLRMRELMHYVDDQKASSACFDDIKGFVEQLEGPAMIYLAHQHLVRLADGAPDAIAARIRLLALKVQYFVATSPLTAERVPGEKPGSTCLVCDAQYDTALCASCLSSIGGRALRLHKSTAKDLAGNAAGDEIVPELAMVVAFCSLRLAFNDERPGYVPSSRPSTRHLLRALLVLEHQLRLTPKHSQISLMLVQLHLRLGSAQRACDIWGYLAVKRIIVDSLAPIFYDRLSTVAPAALAPSDSAGSQLVETLASHYAVSLKLRMPRRLIDAFESGSYSSVMDMPKYVDNLRASCTRAMSLVEEARTDRLLGQPRGTVLSDDRFVETPDDVCLRDVIDYGSLPSWDCSVCPPMHTRLRLGPPPSNQRSHMSLLAEAFHEVLDYQPPSAFKAGAAVAASDHVFVLEMMARLGHSFSKFIPSAAPLCTPAETLYFEAVGLLCVLVPLCAGLSRSDPLPPELGLFAEALQAALESLAVGMPATEGDQVEQVVWALGSLHGIIMLRDAAAAVKLAAQHVLASHERDRSGPGALPHEAVAHVKALQAAADAALAQATALARGLKGGPVQGRNFGGALRTWVLGDADALGGVVDEAAVARLVESWRANVAGWQRVKWE